MEDKKSIIKKGLSIRKVNYILAGIILVISTLLLIVTYNTSVGYKTLHTTTEDYISWQKSASNMMVASDYLTEQVRCFVETGDRQYLDNYFVEAHETRRRDEALDTINRILSDSDAFRNLREAMNQSVLLMDREYYAMRLTIEAYGYDVSDYPEEVQAVSLSVEDASLSNEEKSGLARRLVFDDVYHATKNEISKNTQLCLNELIYEIESRQTNASEKLRLLLLNEQVLIVALIIIVFVIVITTTLQVISPLIHAIPHIKAETPIPVEGANEFRFLAKTYNQMYEANRATKERLTFEATHDQLTGVFNRGGFDKLLKSLDFSTTALLLVDVDKFKGVNDNFGHDIGDKALKRVAEMLLKYFRNDDYICRIGGDEFAVFMLNANSEHSELIRRKIRSINSELQIPVDDIPALSLSVGVAFGTKQRAGNSFKNADIALYKTKAEGGCGCTFSE